MSASNMDYIFYQFLSFSYMSRDLKFAWREVCIIDVGYIVNHFCFMLVIEVVWYVMGLKSLPKDWFVLWLLWSHYKGHNCNFTADGSSRNYEFPAKTVKDWKGRTSDCTPLLQKMCYYCRPLMLNYLFLIIASGFMLIRAIVSCDRMII